MSKTYDVGYKKPPQHTRFKKGQSGNSRGRPKGKVRVADADAVLDDVLSAQIRVNENGRPRKISKLQALLTQTVNKGLKGHHQSTNLVFSHLSKRGVRADLNPLAESQTDEEAKREFEALLNEMAANLAKTPRGAEQQSDNTSEDFAEAGRADRGSSPEAE